MKLTTGQVWYLRGLLWKAEDLIDGMGCTADMLARHDHDNELLKMYIDQSRRADSCIDRALGVICPRLLHGDWLHDPAARAEFDKVMGRRRR